VCETAQAEGVRNVPLNQLRVRFSYLSSFIEKFSIKICALLFNKVRRSTLCLQGYFSCVHAGCLEIVTKKENNQNNVF